MRSSQSYGKPRKSARRPTTEVLSECGVVCKCRDVPYSFVILGGMGAVVTFLLYLYSFSPLALPDIPESAFWNSIIYNWWTDPIALHAIAIGFLGWPFYMYFRARGAGSVNSLGLAFLGCFLTAAFLFLAVEYPLEKFLLKPMFSYPRPSDPLPNPPITEYVMRALRLGETPSAPSGFALRQLFLVLTFLVLVRNRDLRPGSAEKAVSRVFHVLNILLFLGVAFSRIYVRRHTLFDVGLALPIGILVFWFLVVTLCWLLGQTRGESLGMLAAYSIVAFVVSLIYSREASYVVWFFVAIWLCLAVMKYSKRGQKCGFH